MLLLASPLAKPTAPLPTASLFSMMLPETKEKAKP